LEFIPQKQIIQVSPFSYLMGYLIIIIALIILLIAIKDLGRNLSPFPRPINNSNLVTTGIYRFMRHPMYYSLIFFSKFFKGYSLLIDVLQELKKIAIRIICEKFFIMFIF